MQVKDERMRLAVQGRSSNNVEDKETIKYLLAKVDLLQDENRKAQVVNMRTQDMVLDLLAMMKGGSVSSSSKKSHCCTDALSEETTDADSGEETHVQAQKRKVDTTEDANNSKRPKNAFDELSQCSRSVNSTKNFEDYHSKTVQELVKEVVKQDVHVMNGTDPLCVKGKSKNKHTQSLLILRFLGTMCGTPEQFALFSGDNRDRIDTRKKAGIEKRRNDVNELVASIGDNVMAFINTHKLTGDRKNPITKKNLTCGILRGMLEKKIENQDFAASKKTFKTWKAVKALFILK